MNLNIIKNIVVTIGILFFSFFTFVGLTMKNGAGILPVSIGLFGIIISILIIIKRKINNKKIEQEQEQEQEQEPKAEVEVEANEYKFILTVLFFITSVFLIGFLISVPIFMAIAYYIFSNEKTTTHLAIILFFSIFIYLTFSLMLSVPFPEGYVSEWLMSSK